MTYEIRDDVLHLSIPLEMVPNEPARGMLLRCRLGEAKSFRDLLKETAQKNLPIIWDFLIEETRPVVTRGQNKRNPAEGLPPKAGRKNTHAG